MSMKLALHFINVQKIMNVLVALSIVLLFLSFKNVLHFQYQKIKDKKMPRLLHIPARHNFL